MYAKMRRHQGGVRLARKAVDRAAMPCSSERASVGRCFLWDTATVTSSSSSTLRLLELLLSIMETSLRWIVDTEHLFAQVHGVHRTPEGHSIRKSPDAPSLLYARRISRPRCLSSSLSPALAVSRPRRLLFSPLPALSRCRPLASATACFDFPQLGISSTTCTTTPQPSEGRSR